jgi:hypothetical protein
MKTFLSLLAAASLSQVAPPEFTISNRVTSSTSPSTFRSQILNGKTLTGVVVTDWGCAPEDPYAAALQLKARGVNAVDFQHLEHVMRSESGRVRVLSFANVLRLEGVRFSIGVNDKLGEFYPTGIPGLMRDVYAKVPAAVSLWKANLELLRPLWTHPACWKLTLNNEGAQYTTPALAGELFDAVTPAIRKENPNILLTDCADAWSLPNPRSWDPTIAKYDVHECNFYGPQEDFNHPTGGPNWIAEPWAFRTMLWARDAVRDRKKMPFIVGEFGSYRINKDQARNEMFLLVQAQIEGWSTFQFAYATNEAGWRGNSTDRYTMTSDPVRMNTLLFGSYLKKNALGLKVDYWNYATPSSRFEASGDRVSINQDFARVSSNLWNLNPSVPAWARLTRTY